MKKTGFTLIETIIVVGIIGLLLPAIFTIFFAILQQQTKIIRLQEVKRQGDFVLSTMKTTIRNNATKIYSNSGLTEANEKCNFIVPYNGADGQNFYFKDKIGNYFRYYLSDEKISSNSASETIDLTTSYVIISNYSIKCSRQSLYSPAIVSLSITLDYNTSSTRPEDTAQLIYNTNIKLKSF